MSRLCRTRAALLQGSQSAPRAARVIPGIGAAGDLRQAAGQIVTAGKTSRALADSRRAVGIVEGIARQCPCGRHRVAAFGPIAEWNRRRMEERVWGL